MTIQLFIAIGTFAITIGSLIWRMAILSSRVDSTKKGLARAFKKIDAFEEVYTSKVEDLSTQLIALREVQIRMEEKLNQLIKICERRSSERRDTE